LLSEYKISSKQNMFKSGNVYKRDLSTWLEQLMFIGLAWLSLLVIIL